MEKRSITITPRLAKILAELGENIKLARLRRKLTVEQVYERAGIGKTTLWGIEKGNPRIAIGGYLQVLFVLGLEKDFLKVAIDDELGRRIQDAGLIINKRGPKNRL